MRSYLWNVKVVTRNCSTSFKSCFFSLGKSKNDEKVFNMRAKLKLINLWPLCVVWWGSMRAGTKELCQDADGGWFISSPLCFVPGATYFDSSCSYKPEGFIWVPISHSCWEKQPGSGYFMYEKMYVIRMKFPFISGQDNLVIIMAFGGDAGVIILFRLFLFWWAKNCEWLQA